MNYKYNGIKERKCEKLNENWMIYYFEVKLKSENNFSNFMAQINIKQVQITIN